jgi:hypothetical protein
MFQVLAKVVCAKELLGLIALSELVDVGEVFESPIPIGLRKVGELLAAVAARIGGGSFRQLSAGYGRRVEGIMVARAKSSTGPRMTAKVQGVLVTLSFVLIFKPIGAELARVLFFHLVNTVSRLVRLS